MPKPKTYPLVTSEQEIALKLYADAKGQHWRRLLEVAWRTGHYRWDGPTWNLQQLRNTHGPSWLKGYVAQWE